MGISGPLYIMIALQMRPLLNILMLKNASSQEELGLDRTIVDCNRLVGHA